MPNRYKRFINIQLFAEPAGVDEITIKDIEAFLNNDGAGSPPAIDDKTPPATQPGNDDKSKTNETITKIVAARLKDVQSKAIADERENIAKQEGYETYEAWQKAKEVKLLQEKGLDPEEITPVVEDLVKKRIAEDPRLKELDDLRQERIQQWAKKELEDLKVLTGGKITKMEDVPANVVELWKTKGSLKAAYLELEGENLIKSMQAGDYKSSTKHLNTPPGTPSPTANVDKRPMTQKEKEIYKLFNPNVTEEELNKMLKDK